MYDFYRTTIPRIYFCSDLLCVIVYLDTVGLSVMCARLGHNLFFLLLKFKLNILVIDSVMWVCFKKCCCLLRMTYADVVDFAYVRVL